MEMSFSTLPHAHPHPCTPTPCSPPCTPIPCSPPPPCAHPENSGALCIFGVPGHVDTSLRAAPGVGRKALPMT